jgi:predicted phosphoribosyltransferase
VIVAVPVACPRALREVRPWSDEIVWLITPEVYRAIEEFYEGFPAITDHEVLACLREARTSLIARPDGDFALIQFVPSRG